MGLKPTRWQQILDALEARIQSGELRGQLPSYSKLSAEYNTSLITISRVVRELERRGQVTIRPKSGVTIGPTLFPSPALRELQVPLRRIAFLLPVAIADPYWARVADGALSACWDRNCIGRTRWRLEINYGGSPLPHHDLYSATGQNTENLTFTEREAAHEQEKRVILDLSEEVDALLLAPRFVFDSDFYRALFRRGTRILTLDNKVDGVPCVASHSRHAAYKGISYLLLGHDPAQGRLLRRVGATNARGIPAHLAMRAPQIYVIAESPHSNTMRDRLAGCEEALHDAAAHGYRLPLNWQQILPPVKNMSEHVGVAYTTTLRLIEFLENTHQLHGTTGAVQTSSPPVAFFALTDRSALGVYQALQQKGYADWTSPTESIALLSYDNLWQSLEAYSISSLVQDPFHIGERGAKHLFDMPNPTTFVAPGAVPPDDLLEVGLVQRNSTRALPRHDADTQ